MNIVNTISTFASAHVWDIVVIVSVYIGGRILLKILEGKIRRHATKDTRGTRSTTIIRLVHDAGNTILALIIGFWLLRMVGIDPTPLLASAGVLGLALGFGAQTLVKDFIAGLFIIAENQYAVGDRVKISGFEGTVECLSVRSTVLRDPDGNKVFIPNGAVSAVVNQSAKDAVC